MTPDEFLRFEQQLQALCGQFGIWIKSQQIYTDRPQDNLHYRDILLKAKIHEKLHASHTSVEDITESTHKT